MNPSKQTQLINEIDRLVEDELSPEECQRLIARLDDEPLGWRRCAMAFLEAQAWRRGLRPLVEHNTGNTAPIDSAGTWPTHKRIAIAAGLFAAFAGGLLAGASWSPLKHRAVTERPGAALPDVAPVQALTSDSHAVAYGEYVLPADKTGAPFQLVGVVQFEEGSTGPVAVPIISGPGLDEQWVQGGSLPLSDYDREQLERQGWRIVHQRRSSVSVQQTDGSRVTIPYYRLQCQYVGHLVF